MISKSHNTHIKSLAYEVKSIIMKKSQEEEFETAPPNTENVVSKKPI